jgi:hypothetical protein
MTNFTAVNYLQDGARTVAEQKLAFEQNLAATKELLGGLPIQQLTISGTSLTPAAGTAPFIAVATPGGAASANLTNLVATNIKDGSWLALRMANAGQVPTVKHAAGGAGQFSLAGAADLALLDPSLVLLVALSGTTWTEVGRFYGNQVNAHKLFYQAAGLGANRFTGRQDFNKGAALTAAATLVLGTDGNYFTVNGNTNISGIASGNAGTEVTLVFTGTPTLVHSVAFDLGGANVTAQSGMVLRFACDGGTTWRLIGRAGAGSASSVVIRSPGGPSIIGTGAETNIFGVSIPAGMLANFGHVRSMVYGFYKSNYAGLPAGSFTLKHFLVKVYLAGNLMNIVPINVAWFDGAAAFSYIANYAALTIQTDLVYLGGAGGVISMSSIVTSGALRYSSGIILGGNDEGSGTSASLSGFDPALAMGLQVNGQFEAGSTGDEYYKTNGLLIQE